VSLRARLVATLLVLATAGLLVLGAVTYATQRSFLDERLDDQTEFARGPVGRALDEQGSRLEGAPDVGPDRRGGRGPDGPKPAAVSLPAGTYGERRDADGDRIGTPVALLEALAPPDLPDDLEAGDVLTVGARGDGDLRCITTRSRWPRCSSITASTASRSPLRIASKVRRCRSATKRVRSWEARNSCAATAIPSRISCW
jgi:two-component system OmpR family sensor kinase